MAGTARPSHGPPGDEPELAPELVVPLLPPPIGWPGGGETTPEEEKPELLIPELLMPELLMPELLTPDDDPVAPELDAPDEPAPDEPEETPKPEEPPWESPPPLLPELVPSPGKGSTAPPHPTRPAPSAVNAMTSATPPIRLFARLMFRVLPTLRSTPGAWHVPWVRPLVAAYFPRILTIRRVPG